VKPRIERFIYESGLIAQGCWDKFDDYDKSALEKFAELIIEEAHQVIVVGGVDDVDDVLKHFEIE
jgi:hypothetical protein